MNREVVTAELTIEPFKYSRMTCVVWSKVRAT